MTLKYLEDFMEYAEDLPQIFREKMTKIRELDLDVSNRQDRVRKIKLDLRQLQREKKSPGEVKVLVDEVMKEQELIITLSVEKVKIVDGLEEMMVRYCARLCGETEKFKMELEADTPGITHRLEAKAMEELRKTSHFLNPNIPMTSPTNISPRRKDRLRKPLKSHQNSLGNHDFSSQPPVVGLSRSRSSLPVLQPVPIPQTFRAASVDAAIQVVFEKGPLPQSDRRLSFTGFPTLDDAAAFIDHFQKLVPEMNDRPKMQISGLAAPLRQSSRRLATILSQRSTCSTSGLPHNMEPEPVEEESKEYCVCKDSSIRSSSAGGLMIACDNSTCPREWFHAECVGIAGKALDEIATKNWYCPLCQPQFLGTKIIRGVNSRKNVRVDGKGHRK